MASSKEREKEPEYVAETKQSENKNMRRGKPQQQIYRPGSGPLRKSTPGIEETESDTKLVVSKQNKNKPVGLDRLDKLKSADTSPRDSSAAIETITSKLGDVAIDNGKKKPKKPEQSFYVARPVALAREAASNDEALNKSDYPKSNLETSIQANGSDNYNNSMPDRLHNTRGSKRYSNRRYGENLDNQDDWRTSHVKGPRQGSEPRAMSNQNNNYNNRIRDTRSVEPVAIQNRTNCPNDKVMNRPPSGRRHSTIGLEQEKRLKNLDNLPPRLKKKYLEDNNLAGNYNRNEEQWDGSSITFQGSQNYGSKQDYNFATLPSNSHQNIQNQRQQSQNNVMYHTLPSRGPRGRGRGYYDYGSAIGMYRSATPERMYASPVNSRPHTPPTFDNTTRSNENLHRQEGGYHSYRNDNSKYSEERRSMDRFNDERRRRDRYSTERDRYNRGNENKYRDEKYHRGNDRNTNNNQSSTINKDNVKEVVVNEYVEQPKTPRPFRESLEAQLSPVSPPTPPEKDIKPTVPVNNTILDWSEEVELNDRLEAEALSDALTRSSSIASLMETSTKSQPPPTHSKKSKKKRNRRNSQRRSNSRNRDHTPESLSSRQQPKNQNRDERAMSSDPHHVRKSSITSIESRDNFKVPESRRRRHSRSKRDGSYDRSSRGASRESSFDRRRKSSCNEQENWRDEARKRQNSERDQQQPNRDADNKDVRKGGLLILPSTTGENTKILERPKCPDISRKSSNIGQKTLFDPNNPHKPIIVKSPNSRISVPGFADNMETPPPQLYTTDQFGNVRPAWYDENSDKIKQSRYPDLLREIIIADTELQCNINSGMILINWENVSVYRNFLMKSLEYLLCKDMKFCQSENVEQHFWKILFYNIIEMMRKTIVTDPSNKEQYKGFLLYLIDEGVKYFEMLLERLEEVYNFKIVDYLGYNTTPTKGKFVGLVLVSIQKIFLYLGDLLRYKEQVNETSNYGKCRQWYVKANEINPKNGKPYNQLALLAVYARRKLDAVYYYMRSLMSSNPAPSARESLNSLFDENRKKYEQGERKRREERLERARQHMKEKESQAVVNHPNSLRREVWVRPDGGRRVHRTTSAVAENQHMDSEEEDLAALSSVEVNKRFVTSYLHVHGKLITKIGMESFQETAIQMLKEFRALLQHSPVPLPCKRFLQLLALNMFAIESTQLKDPQLQSQSGYRSELQERALVVSLQMFSLILERCVSLLQEHIKSKKGQSAFPQDLQILLPAVKVWCDWMLCHSGVWNPPPSTQDYKIGAPGDAWTRIATLMNLLEKLDLTACENFVSQIREGFEQIRLPEDAVLSEFTPLMHNIQEATFVSKDFDVEIAQFTLRINKLLFFGTVFLCGLEPPVLKLEIENDYNEYISVVRTSSSRSSPPSPPELNNDDDLLVESFSEDEEGEPEDSNVVDNAPSEIRDLLSRKVELEKRQRHQELHRQRVQKILRQSVVSVHIEVRPKYLIPDTNCFIDYLDMIKSIASAHVYTLMVPLVVLNELEGLAKGGRSPAPVPRSAPNPEHMVMVAESAKHALDFVSVKNPNVKCITTKGTILTSSTFTVEDDSVSDAALKNDDKILASCLAFCRPSKDQHGEGEPRKLYREVVLLTDDRNLRVKALARDVPVRELPDFIQWAGLG